MLVIQSLYLVAMVLKVTFKNQIWAERQYDIINSILMVSYILMYIGFSNSIKKTFSANQKQKMKGSQ